MTQSPWTCPDPACAAVNPWTAAYCEACGTQRGTQSKPATRSAWTCETCHSRSPGMPTLRGDDGVFRCSGCHFDAMIRPRRSQATDLCDATECEGMHPHAIGRHIAECRAHVGRFMATRVLSTDDQGVKVPEFLERYLRRERSEG